jgi:hypothetical protein
MNDGKRVLDFVSQRTGKLGQFMILASQFNFWIRIRIVWKSCHGADPGEV